MSHAIKVLFNDISPTYDKLNHVLSLNIDKLWRKRAIASLDSDDNAALVVLDLCAGTYDLSLACLKRFKNAKITAADFSQGMLNAGLEKIKKHLSSGQITPLCADALDLQLPDESFDIVMCAYGMRNLDDTARAILEIKRVLKPGGQVLILEFFKPDSFAAKLFHLSFVRFIIPTLGKWLSGHVCAYRYLRDSIQGFMTREKFNNCLKENGFEIMQSRDLLMSVSSIVLGKK